jgi:transposase-like protein
MRYSASGKLEIIELVEQSTLSVGRTLTSIGIPRSTFYDWYSRYQDGGIEALEDGKPRPGRVWNKIPDEIGTAIVNLALEEPDLSPRELAVNFTDSNAALCPRQACQRHFVGKMEATNASLSANRLRISCIEQVYSLSPHIHKCIGS